MFQFRVDDVVGGQAQAQQGGGLGDFVRRAVEPPVPSEAGGEDASSDRQTSSCSGKGRGKGKRSAADRGEVLMCVACDQPRKSGSTWCCDHKRGYDTIYKAVCSL